jgi:invasion protein IalB
MNRLAKHLIRLGFSAATVFLPALAMAQAQPQKPPAKPQPAAASSANQAARIESSGSWGAYASQQGRNKVCYALSKPNERLPKNLNRDPAYLFVSIRSVEKVRGEVSFVLGFPGKDGGPAEAVIDDKTYPLVVKGDKAWVGNPAEEPQFVAALRDGTDLVVKLTSARGNTLTDKYSLAGFQKSWERALKECP